jgi:hypothetical protein
MTEPTYEFLKAENKRLTHLLKKRIYSNEGGRLRMVRCENCADKEEKIRTMEKDALI